MAPGNNRTDRPGRAWLNFVLRAVDRTVEDNRKWVGGTRMIGRNRCHPVLESALNPGVCSRDVFHGAAVR